MNSACNGVDGAQIWLDWSREESQGDEQVKGDSRTLIVHLRIGYHLLMHLI